MLEGSFRTAVEVAPVGGGIRAVAIVFMKAETGLDPLHSGYQLDYQGR
jgi:hypothetical protein